MFSTAYLKTWQPHWHSDWKQSYERQIHFKIHILSKSIHNSLRTQTNDRLLFRMNVILDPLHKPLFKKKNKTTTIHKNPTTKQKPLTLQRLLQKPALMLLTNLWRTER